MRKYVRAATKSFLKKSDERVSMKISRQVRLLCPWALMGKGHNGIAFTFEW